MRTSPCRKKTRLFTHTRNENLASIAVALLCYVSLALAAGAEDDKGLTVSPLLPGSTVVSERVVSFSWPVVMGAWSYEIEVRWDRNLGKSDDSILSANLVSRRRSGNLTKNVDLAATDVSTVDKTIYWGIRPILGKFGTREEGDWIGPVAFRYKPAKGPPREPLPASDVVLAINCNLNRPVADGQSVVEVVAVVTDQHGKPVADQQVRFFVRDYLEDADGNFLGGGDNPIAGQRYRVIPSGAYLPDDDDCPSNLFTTRTGDNGRALARFRTARWHECMGQKPMTLGVWYQVDGGGNPKAETQIWFAKPE